MSTIQSKHSSIQYLTPLTPSQMKDVEDLIVYTEANRKPLRKPRHRKRDPSSAPRPVNCFLVYRKEKQAQIAELCSGANHRVISKIVARWWKNIDSSTRSLYVDVAKQVKQDHAIKFPGYKYAPKRKGKSTSEDAKKPATTRPVSPSNYFFGQLEGNQMPQTSTAVATPAPTTSTSPTFFFDMAKQFLDMVCAPQSLSGEQNDSYNAPLLSQPLVDDSMAQYMDTQQWQTENNGTTTSNQMMIQPQMLVTNAPQAIDWMTPLDQQENTLQSLDAVHPLDLGESGLGYGTDDFFWALDATSFVSNNNNNMLDMMCTPALLSEYDSPLSVSSSDTRPPSFPYDQSIFVNPAAAIKATTYSTPS